MTAATHRLAPLSDDYVVPMPRATDAVADALRRAYRADNAPPADMLALLRRLGNG